MPPPAHPPPVGAQPARASWPNACSRPPICRSRWGRPSLRNGDQAALHQQFQRAVGTSPAAYRRAFRTTTPATGARSSRWADPPPGANHELPRTRCTRPRNPTVRFGIWPSPARSLARDPPVGQPLRGLPSQTAHSRRPLHAERPRRGRRSTATPWSARVGLVGALAVSVPRLTLGSLVTSVTYRHPAVLAKVAAAVDQLSQGPVGARGGRGVAAEPARASYGIALGDGVADAYGPLRRGPRDPRINAAQPPDQLRRDVLFRHRTGAQPAGAGSGPTADHGRWSRRAAGRCRMAARYADRWNSWTTPDVLDARMRILRERCEAIGRDPAEISVSTQALLFLSTDESWLAQTTREPDGPGGHRRDTGRDGRHRRAIPGRRRRRTDRPRLHARVRPATSRDLRLVHRGGRPPLSLRSGAAAGPSERPRR